MSHAKIVVIGAGVAGLTTALLLAKKRHHVTVVAKHMPGDYDIQYTSPWAGANFFPFSTSEDDPARRWERNTHPELWRLATQVPESGIHVQDARLYVMEGLPTPGFMEGLMSEDPWFKNLVHGFRVLEKPELPKDAVSGTAFKSVCINTAIYLPFLLSQCLRYRVAFRRGIVNHVADAANMHVAAKKADLVVNCSGLMACKLGGVMDSKLIPARGQIVVVRNEAPAMYTTSAVVEGDEEMTYIMMRAAGGGTILGGCYQKGNWSPEIDPNLANRIMKRCVDICPELAGGKGVEGLDIIRHSVGLRPWREGGARVESELIDGVKVVHNYGAAGWGYQASYGMSEDTVALVEESLKPQAKL
ncbi:hypothetical protein H072_6130 [Dactylellina haptotyla CBS 200.50]|uniref:D-amino-acid oxidase n=1 Tax=Dactylellina haptotyla (strain CBS 200.50) TaxID=1284197 RepID=S8AFT9_DACHA|nr:hypothetical protein H072_6130 [Dactylellina haptotyla CBS 200.50]